MRLLLCLASYLYMGSCEYRLRISNIEQGISNFEGSSVLLLSVSSTFEIPCSIFDISGFLTSHSQGIRDRAHDFGFRNGPFFPRSEVLDLPNLLGELVGPGDESDSKASAFGELQLLAHFLGLRKNVGANPRRPQAASYALIVSQTLGAKLDDKHGRGGGFAFEQLQLFHARQESIQA